MRMLAWLAMLFMRMGGLLFHGKVWVMLFGSGESHIGFEFVVLPFETFGDLFSAFQFDEKFLFFLA